MIDPKAEKQAFFAGDKEAVMYCPTMGPDPTSYNLNMTGVKVPEDRRAEVLDFNRTSYVLTTMPDTIQMGKFNITNQNPFCL